MFASALAQAQPVAPQPPPRPEAGMRVVILGSGTPAPVIDRFGPSVLVQAGDGNWIVDCGRGALQRLVQVGVPWPRIDGVLFTHLHSDHLVGFPDAWLTGWYILGRDRPLPVWGPRGIGGMTEHLPLAYATDIHTRRDLEERFPAAGVEIETHEIAGQGVLWSAGLTVTAFEVLHGEMKPAYGYRFDFGGRSVVLSGDTTYSENLVKSAAGADLILHEVLNPATLRRRAPHYTDAQVKSVLAHHTTPQQAGTVFARIDPKLAVYYHVADTAEALDPPTRETYGGPLLTGSDLMVIDVAEQVRVYEYEAAGWREIVAPVARQVPKERQ